MLNSINKKTIDECLTKISKYLPGYKMRSGQLAMINAVAETLSRTTTTTTLIEEDSQLAMPLQNGESILVVEGPTGIGKSLGYLLPAIVIAKSFKKQLVVSSATVALQEQLAHNDIPLLAQHAGLNISFALAKGRSRYVCPSRLYNHQGLSDQTDLFSSNLVPENSEQIIPSEQLQFLQQLTTNLENGSWSGERDSLQQAVPDALWAQVTNDRHGCIKRRCAYFSACPFYKARAELEKVDIIIANHDLLLADIAMGAGTILPHPTDAFYCIDEAHHLADKAIKQFSASHSILGTQAWLERIPVVVSRAVTILKEYHGATKIISLTESLAEYLRDLNVTLENIPELRSNSALYRCPHGKLPEALTTLRDNLAGSSQALLAALSLLQDALRRKKQQPEEHGHNLALEKILSDLGFLHGRTENMTAVWTLYQEQTPDETAPIAKWFTAQLMKNNQVDYVVHASHVRIAKLLADRFWQYVAGAVLTSATLRSLGSFDLLLSETGLKHYPQTTCLALESPFNLSEQATLVIPAMETDPKDPIGHTQELITLLPKLIHTELNEGTLVLFSSRKQMLDVAQALPENLRQLLLIQGQQSKEILLSQHFARITANQPSILFGLASFAEGLDLPGNACTHVIIAKLPFAVPDEPVSQTLAEWITTQGKNAFHEITLPVTSIKLIQAVGRLIRSETDTGTVTILDKRLKTQSYGKRLLKALPPFRIST